MNNDTATDSSDDEQYSRHAKKCFEKKKLQELITPRPNASGGYWLCCLLPLALGVAYLKQSACHISNIYEQLTIAACGMCLQSLFFFIYAFNKLGLPIDVLISCTPVALTALLYKYVLLKNWWLALIWAFGINYGYQRTYIKVMRELHKCFSYGECALFVQGCFIFVLNAANNTDVLFLGYLAKNTHNVFSELSGIMLFALSCLFAVSLMIYQFSWLRKATGFYPLLAALILIVCCAPITQPIPILKVLHFILYDQTRRLTVIFYAVLVAFTVLTVKFQLQHNEKATTSIRKIFHLLIVLVYVPGILFECAFIYLASGVALAFFVVLEIMRICNIPPLATTLKSAFTTFSDEKDAGILALTPFCLLIGCSLPLWINPCVCSEIDSSANNPTLLPLLSGILAVGFGDTAASVVGFKFGKRKWRDSTRSIEGTLAFIITVLLAVCALNTLGFIVITQAKWFVTIEATIVTALVEAHTDQIDNLVLPLVFYIIVSLG